MTELKRCTHCNTRKPYSEFYRIRKTQKCVMSYCKAYSTARHRTNGRISKDIADKIMEACESS